MEPILGSTSPRSLRVSGQASYSVTSPQSTSLSSLSLCVSSLPKFILPWCPHSSFFYLSGDCHVSGHNPSAALGVVCEQVEKGFLCRKNKNRNKNNNNKNPPEKRTGTEEELAGSSRWLRLTWLLEEEAPSLPTVQVLEQERPIFTRALKGDAAISNP